MLPTKNEATNSKIGVSNLLSNFPLVTERGGGGDANLDQWDGRELPTPAPPGWMVNTTGTHLG